MHSHTPNPRQPNLIQTESNRNTSTTTTTDDDDATPNPWGDEDQVWALQEHVSKYKAQFDSVQKNGKIII